MCGIAGILTARPAAEAERRALGMLRAIQHRGPDGNAVSVTAVSGSRVLALAHARLAVLDLSPHAAQPMWHRKTGNALIYNGEVYNYREMRPELEREGWRFTSTGDTEVVLAALSTWGANAITRLEGMFAFAFWDAGRGELLLGRDRMGIKPLYVARTADGVVFASEVRGVAASGLVDCMIDESAIASMLHFGAVVGPNTMYAAVRSLVPGTLMRFDREGRVTEHEMASLADLALATPRHVPFSEAVAESGAHLARAVEDQLVSDVPIGVCLSGGVDSTLIATYAAQSRKQSNLTLLTIDGGEKGFTERARATRVSRNLQVTHRVVELSASQLFDYLPAAVAAMDQPTSDGVNTFIISAVARDLGLKVLLSGLGGDEVFGGYTTFWKVPFLFRHRRLLSAGARLAMAARISRSPQTAKVASADRLRSFADAYLLQRSIRWEGTGPISESPLLRSAPTDLPIRAALEGSDPRDDFRRVALLESNFYMRNQLLRDADVFSSAHGVEMRVPFLDSRLVRHVWSYPASHHVRRRSGKRILRALVAAQYGHAQLGRKMGFVLPWDVWLRSDVANDVADTLQSREAAQHLGVAPHVLPDLLQSFRANRAGVSWLHVLAIYGLAKRLARA